MSLFGKQPAARVSADGATAGRDLTVQNAGCITNYFCQSFNSAPNRICQLQTPSPNFIGRTKVIEKGLSLSTNYHNAVKSPRFALFGMGGIGKTAIALVLADNLKSKYSKAQLQIDLRGATDDKQSHVTPAEAMASIIRALEPTMENLEGTEDQLIPRYRDTMSNHAPGILLLDNALSAGQVRPLLPPNGWFVLITARRHFYIEGLQSEDVDVLPRQESIALIRNIATKRAHDLSESVADTLAALTADLPLAIELAAAALNVHEDVPVAEYLAQLSVECSRLEALAHDESDQYRKLDASINMSVRLLSDSLRDRFLALSFFPKGSDFDVAAAAAIWGFSSTSENKASSRQAISELRASSLVRWSKESDRYSLHDLIRLWGIGRLEPQTREKLARFYINPYTNKLTELETQGTTPPIQLESALRAFDSDFGNVAYAFTLACQLKDTQQLSRFATEATRIRELRHGATMRVEWANAILPSRLDDAESIWHARALLSKAIAFLELGQPREALPLCDRALEILRVRHDRPLEARISNNLGNAFMDLGDAKQAIAYYQNYLDIARDIGNRLLEAGACGNLGNALLEIGDPIRAIELHRQRLKICREIGHRQGKCRALGNLARVLIALGDSKRAMRCLKKVLSATTDIGDRQGQRNALFNLGSAQFVMGDVKQSVYYYEQSLLVSREIGDRRMEAETCWNLGLAHYRVKDFTKAFQLMKIWVDYVCSIGHAESDKYAAILSKIQDAHHVGDVNYNPLIAQPTFPISVSASSTCVADAKCFG